MKVLYANGVVSYCTSKLKAPDLCSVINTAKNPVERERERERERDGSWSVLGDESDGDSEEARLGRSCLEANQAHHHS